MVMQTTSEDYAQLRGKGCGPDGSGGIDGSDPFMSGHRICRTRRPKRRLPAPDWAMNDTLTRELIQKMYPAWDSPEDPRYIKHRYRATLYTHILYRFFREGEKVRYIWEELREQEIATRAAVYDNPIERYRRKVLKARPLTERRVERIIRELRHAAAGLRRNGKPRTNGKRGPKPKTKNNIAPVINTI
jgi:hypothetical protein